MKCRIFNTIASICVLLLPAGLFAQTYSNVSSVVDGSGKSSGGGAYSNISAAAQPSGISVSLGGTFVNYAGFLNTFSLQASLDTDNDGLANEVDTDNDNDDLGDTVELAGIAFDPNTVTDLNNPDSDGDGQNDGDESTAGTNPDDPDATFEITAIALDTAGVLVSWIGRGGKTYDIYSGSDLAAGISDFLLTTNVAGGNPPWYVTTSSFVDDTAFSTNIRFYLIKVTP
jgi:hypothetical protein